MAQTFVLFGGVFGFDCIKEAKVIITTNLNGNVIEMYPTKALAAA